MLDFGLNQKKIAVLLLLLGSSIGLGGASNTCSDETRGLTLSMKNLVSVAFLEHQWRERGSSRGNLEDWSACSNCPPMVLLSLCLEGPDIYV